MLQKHLFKNGIETKIHYPLPIHLQKHQKLKLRSSNLPSMKEFQRKYLLPVNQYLKDRISKIINSIKIFIKVNELNKICYENICLIQQEKFK